MQGDRNKEGEGVGGRKQEGRGTGDKVRAGEKGSEEEKKRGAIRL